MHLYLRWLHSSYLRSRICVPHGALPCHQQYRCPFVASLNCQRARLPQKVFVYGLLLKSIVLICQMQNYLIDARTRRCRSPSMCECISSIGGTLLPAGSICQKLTNGLCIGIYVGGGRRGSCQVCAACENC